MLVQFRFLLIVKVCEGIKDNLKSFLKLKLFYRISSKLPGTNVLYVRLKDKK